MAATTSTADSVGTEVTQILDEATVAAAELLAGAEHRAVRAGWDDLARLRDSLEERMEAVREARERLRRLGDEITPRLREAASELSDMPARLAAMTGEETGDAPLDRALGTEESADDGPPAHVLALIKAADAIAEDLTKTARGRAHQVEEAARREADRIARSEPKRMAQAYDPAARRAETLRREVNALSQLLSADENVARADGVRERTRGWTSR